MKKIIIGGFLSLIGAIWGMGIIILVGNNLTSSWSMPPGRFLTTVIEIGMVIPMIMAFAFLLFGLFAIGTEYFKEDN
jgi:hypothetical protein